MWKKTHYNVKGQRTSQSWHQGGDVTYRHCLLINTRIWLLLPWEGPHLIRADHLTPHCSTFHCFIVHVWQDILSTSPDFLFTEKPSAVIALLLHLPLNYIFCLATSKKCFVLNSLFSSRQSLMSFFNTQPQEENPRLFPR